MSNMEKTLLELKREMNEVMGQWDGDSPGRAEERVSTASDIVDRINEIEKLLSDLDEF
jgi:hypothetical protein